MEEFYDTLKKIDDEGKQIISEAEAKVVSMVRAAKEDVANNIDASKKMAVEKGYSLQDSFLLKLNALRDKKDKELGEQIETLKEIVEENRDAAIELVLDMLEKEL